MIIIAGDSWACGEWKDCNVVHGGCHVVHGGLSKYLNDAGHDVFNIGVGGSSNFMTVDKLEATLSLLQARKCLTDDSVVIAFQTEWHRDFRQTANDHLYGFCENVEVPFFKPNVAIDQFFIEKLLSRYYYRLSDIAQKFSIPIHLVGGCSDTMWFDKFTEEYPGLSILCQSLTEFLTNNSTRIDNPVFSVKFTEVFLNLIKSQAKSIKDTEYILTMIDQGDNRLQLWNSTPEYFWPDGAHPNRKGHLILYQLIKNQLFDNS